MTDTYADIDMNIDNRKNSKTENFFVQILQFDITKMEVDAIVNAAHEDLTGGGGVDGAIHKAAGFKLIGECLNLYGCPEGECRITNAYELPSKYVIHTVGPVWRPVDNHYREIFTLSRCYYNCLQMAEMQGLKSIAFPCISTGAFGFPKRLASDIALNSISYFFNEKVKTYLDEIYIVCFDDENYNEYQNRMSMKK